MVKRYNSPAILFLDKEGPLVSFEDYEKLVVALRRIATLEPAQGKRSRVRAALVHVQSIAVAALGESIPLGIDRAADG